MMKRQFLRVKQIADQTFQRGEKTEVLTDELTAAEKRVELIKQACQNSGKKLSACMQRLACEGASTDRKSPKKTPEALLAQCQEEWGLNLGENSILGMTMVDCARLQDALACDLLHYKMEVEESVVEPLQNILKIDVANVVKSRKQLAKLTAEMDASKLRYQTALKNCQQTSSNGLATAVAKVDSLKEESEDAITKVEQCRDVLSAEMFNLISREPELSRLFVKLCQLQLEYHKAALAVLESTVPELEAQINSCPYHPVFGIPLEDHLRYTNREIAIVIETCVCWLLETAMDEEGLFRIGGSVTKIKKMKSAFDAGVHYLLEDEKDHHNIAGVLKLYLRSLPEPLLTYGLYEDWMKAARIRDHDLQLQALWTVVNSLPEANRKNLRYLIKFFSKLCQNSEVNKMSSQNIAIVVGPNMLWSPIEENALGMNMTATNLHSSIIDILIKYADWFFPGDCEFYISTPTSPRHLNNGFLGSLRGSQLCLSMTKLSTTDSAVDSLSSSPTNSPKSPRGVPRPKKKNFAPIAPHPSAFSKYQITRSMSCNVFQQNVNGQEIRSKSLSHQSSSHEDILSATLNEVTTSNISVARDLELNHVNQTNNNKTELMNGGLKPVVKPPRTRPKGFALPPLMEKANQRNSAIERPTVPPPERPTSVKYELTNNHQMSPNPAPPISAADGHLVDISDIDISIPNNDECTKAREDSLTFMDDSDFEDDSKSPSSEVSQKSTDSQTNQIKDDDDDVLGTGTPKWFEHYNGSCRQSNSIWFAHEPELKPLSKNSEDSVFSEENDAYEGSDSVKSQSSVFPPDSSQNGESEQYCTIIPVGDKEAEEEYKPLYKFSPPQDATIKLRVNSNSQNTRL